MGFDSLDILMLKEFSPKYVVNQNEICKPNKNNKLTHIKNQSWRIWGQRLYQQH